MEVLPCTCVTFDKAIFTKTYNKCSKIIGCSIEQHLNEALFILVALHKGTTCVYENQKWADWPTNIFLLFNLSRGFLFRHFLGSEITVPHSFPFASNCDQFCCPADANETALSSRDGEAAQSYVPLWPWDVDVYCQLGPCYIPSAS